jgi:predicted MFS family arabinose efflux permease
MEDRTQIGMTGRYALPFLGVACAVGVGSIYYNQPLLLVMGKSFHQTARAMGFVAVATQVGYACGIMGFVPLGDVTDRRKLMTRMYACVSLALLTAAIAQNLATAICASVLIGIMAAVTHVVLPMAPDLVPPERRGQAIGTVMTGLLLGVLLARTFAGWVSNLAGWRAVYLVAALINLAFVPLIYRVMPRTAPRETLTYGNAMRSLWTLFRDEPLLRESGLIGGLVFAAFSCFWTTLTFFLAKYYGLGPGVAGSFGIVGAAGATIAPFAGRLADKHGPRYVLTLAGGLLTVSYLFLGSSVRLHIPTAFHLGMLVLGVLTLDVGAQMMQVGNQTRIFGLGESVRSRLNTLYMTMFFVGGAVGSALASLVWARWEWNGVCVLEIGLMAAAGIVHATGYSRTHPQKAAHIAAREVEIA